MVLVGVLKSNEDLRILLEEKWYRIPLAFLPKRKFTYIAFYEPARVYRAGGPQTTFGKVGKRIELYARVSKRQVKKRIELLPHESAHPRANDDYLCCSFRKIEKLETPIRNVIPRRVSFGFTDLKTLRSAHDILELYHVAPTEQIIEQELCRIGIRAIPQYRISLNSPLEKGALPSSAGGMSSPPVPRRGLRGGYRLDLAIFCKNGNLAIECDNRKAHSGKVQKLKDNQKDRALRTLGWRVLRLKEQDILEHRGDCISRIQKVIASLGGILLSKGGGESASRRL